MTISCSQNYQNEILAVPPTPSSTSNNNTNPKLNISTVVVAIHMGTVYSHLRKWKQAGGYSHLLILLTDKTVLIYLRHLQQCCQPSGLALWYSARYQFATSPEPTHLRFESVRGKIFINFILTFLQLAVISVCCGRKITSCGH